MRGVRAPVLIPFRKLAHCFVLTGYRKVGNKPVGKSGGPTIKKQVGKLDGAVGGIERAEKSEGGK